MDLKHLLIESNQGLPNFLMNLQGNEDTNTGIECLYCGGLGHKLNQCHKLENQRIKRQNMHISEKR